jgi:hypothetical protein
VLEEVSFEEACAEIAKIYDCRSDLVHGSVSPFDEKVAERVRRTYEITRVVLLGALDYYFSIGLEDRKNTETGLRGHFQKLEKWNADGRPESPAVTA